MCVLEHTYSTTVFFFDWVNVILSCPTVHALLCLVSAINLLHGSLLLFHVKGLVHSVIIRFSENK